MNTNKPPFENKKEKPLWIVIPTYNERENIKPLVNSLKRIIDPGDYILLVDDSSPDQTEKIAEKMKRETSFLRVIHREKKEGLGPAYMEGFSYALRNGAKTIIQMDADLSHRPVDIPSLLSCLSQADLVIGSRYIKGGKITNWNFLRRLLSRWGNLYAQLILQTGIKDMTSGFKCFNEKALRAIEFTEIKSKGYAFQIEVTCQALDKGLKVREAPITFLEREKGTSKIDLAIILEAIWRVPRLGQRKRKMG